jgi:hypothetical protein
MPGLIGLKGGGYPGMDSTMTSTVQEHPLGAIAYDSSGGEYIFARGCSTVPTMNSLVVLIPNSSAGVGSSLTGGTWNAQTLVATQTSSAMTNGGPIGIVMSTAQSTSIYAWFQIYGHCNVSADSTLTANTQLFTSSVAAGNVMATTTGARIYGLSILSSGGSSGAQEAFAQYPHVQSA